MNNNPHYTIQMYGKPLLGRTNTLLDVLRKCRRVITEENTAQIQALEVGEEVTIATLGGEPVIVKRTD